MLRFAFGLLPSWFIGSSLALSAAMGCASEVSDQVREAVAHSCVKCHGPVKPKGGLDLESLLTADFNAKTLALWTQVDQQLADGSMPPKDAPPMPSEQRAALHSWITIQLARAVRPADDPGPAPMRRLTRMEAQRTLEALFGVPVREALSMPPEVIGEHGFASLAAIQTVTTDDVRQRLDVARGAASQIVSTSAAGVMCVPSPAIGEPFAGSLAVQERLNLALPVWQEAAYIRILDALTQVQVGQSLSAVAASTGLPVEVLSAAMRLASANYQADPVPDQISKPKRDELVENELPAIRGALIEMGPSGHGSALERDARLIALAKTIAHLRRAQKPAPGSAGADLELAFPLLARKFQPAIRAASPPKIPPLSNKPLLADLDFAAWFLTSAQRAEVTATQNAVNELYAAERTAAIPATPPGKLAPGKSPKLPTSTASPGPVQDVHPDGAGDDAHCRWLAEFTRRAWRRPLTADEVAGIISYYQQRRTRQAGPTALRETVARILVAPDFWYRVEPAVSGAGRAAPLPGPALAVRLSYTLWGAPPDAELSAAAATGALSSEDGLRIHVRRMLGDPRASGLIDDFLLTWLGLADWPANGKVPDPLRFPIPRSGSLFPGLKEELRAFAADLVRNDAPVITLLTADWTYLNEELARYYGIGKVTGQLLRRVTVADQERGGLFGQAAMLISTSYNLRTSPVIRGSWILQDLVGRKLPPPPPDAGSLPTDDKQPDGLSLRQRLEQHRREPRCAACHDHIDPLGFALERFGADGRLRKTDINGKPIEDWGVARDGQRIVGKAGLQAWILAQRQPFVRHFATRFAAYALGRVIDASDQAIIDAMVQASPEGRLWPMVEALVLHPAFRQIRTTQAKGD
ncbi:hypothetical protein LBMAG53_17090 [Planctomycetota bacterium]|nr:hypothetical protein LBMAG53_17090 [Planctomycetota bacterium]